MRDTDSKKHPRDDDSSNSGAKAYELRLWPPPRMQAYCLDHFMVECEIYHEQENDRYNKLVKYSRETFLEKQNHEKLASKSTPAPTRIQPSRKAKEKQLASGTKPPMTPQEALRPTKSSNIPFKPAKLEKAFKESQQGAMFQILTELYKKLDLQKSWKTYRVALKGKIQEIANQLLVETENGVIIHRNCVFRSPLEVECRYCGFVETIQDEEAVTPRKLAPPAPMRAIKYLSEGNDIEESRLMFCGTEFIVDVCGEKTMIVLVNLKGLLDLCTEMLEEEDVVPGSPTSLFARLGNMKRTPSVIKASGTEEQADEPVSNRGRKRQKSRRKSAG
ncbi:hypothetical protein F5Y09DRAFT_334810 [Xylaria sp. FL1042]|nr:hypothetical protein F5Y09DRAFT_334810 [Xylaria sp. FL1042]